MISTSEITLRYGKRTLFENVSLEFSPGNCYGLIGANGAGKSTFLKILAGEIEPDSGHISRSPKSRLSVLRQDHFAFDEYSALDAVFEGNPRLFKIMKARDELYEKGSNLSDEEGMKLAELETEFAELEGWNAESEAAVLLNGLGIPDELHTRSMRELSGPDKVRVLLAQALFGNPDILLLDEPTNHLDPAAMAWLEKFLDDFENTVILVSHDRHFLDAVCTHIADIDYQKIQLYTGNYSDWYEATRLELEQRKALKEKNEKKISQLKEFVARFGANAARSRQATSRKKQIEKLRGEAGEIRPSSRKYPYIVFSPERRLGKDLLFVEELSKSINGETLFSDVSVTVAPGEKVAFISRHPLAVSAFFDILMERARPDGGSFKWGATTEPAYFPKESGTIFDGDTSNLVEWLRPHCKEQDEQTVRSFLGRMLFKGEETMKSVDVLSGGERVRCLLARMMASGANVLLFDEPTAHLDLEAIAALNESLVTFDGSVLFSSHDRRFVDTGADRIVELTPNGVIDELMPYTQYLANEEIARRRAELYGELLLEQTAAVGR